MERRLDRVLALSVGKTTAQTVELSGMECVIRNNSATATVYFKEKSDDGAAASAANGWALGPGERTQFPVVISQLSIIASDASTDVRIALFY